METTKEKLNNIVNTLIEAEDALSTVLDTAGKDCETQYTKPYLTQLESLECLQKALHKLLHEDFYYTVMAVDEMQDEPQRTCCKADFGEFVIDVAKAAGL